MPVVVRNDKEVNMERSKLYKKTLLIDSSDDKAIKDAAEHLRNGEVVGFPTETVYGL